MERDHKRYLRAVKNALSCDKATRQRLLAGLREELPGGLDLDALYKQFGEPAQLAAELMQNLPAEVLQEGQRRCKHRIFLCIGSALVIIAALVASINVLTQQYQKLKERDIKYIEAEPVYAETREPSSADAAQEAESHEKE